LWTETDIRLRKWRYPAQVKVAFDRVIKKIL
jgi:hypothetical protein